MISRLWHRFAEWFTEHCPAATPTFRYEGLCGFEPSDWPRRCVLYNDGGVSMPMPIGNARDYAKIFGGRLITVREARALLTKQGGET